MVEPRKIDLLNEPIPDEWLSTRHCPDCGSTTLRVSSDEVELDRWCTTYCADCGRVLRRDFVGGEPTWEDPEWTKSGEQ